MGKPVEIMDEQGAWPVRDFTVHEGEGIPEEAVSYPDFTFEYKESHFCGSGVIEASDESRANSVLRGIADLRIEETTNTGEVQKVPIDDLDYLAEPRLRERHLGRVRNYMSQNVTVENPRLEDAPKELRTRMPKDITLKRHEALTFDEVSAATNEVLSSLKAMNHPVAQALEQLEATFKDVVYDPDDHRLTEANIENVKTRVLIHTHWNELKSIYAETLDQKRSS